MIHLSKHRRLRFAAASILSLLAATATAEPVETTLKGAFQSYFQDYEFRPAGGEFLSYNVGLTLDGDQATISGLFNLELGYPEDYSVEYDIKGVYDATAHTLTIPTPRQFDKATVVGYIYNYMPGVLLSGTMDDDGSMQTDDKLVFTVSDDGSRLSTDKAFGVMTYGTEGSAIGWKCLYKGGVILDLSKGSELVCFTDSLDLGRCYRDASMPGQLNVFNLSKKSATITVTSDSPVFAPNKETVKASPLGTATIGLKYLPTTEGQDAGKLTLECGGLNTEVKLTGECVTPIDFSSIVEEGEMHISTGAMYPFSVVEYDGHPAATSGCRALDGCESKLTVTFDVPEGELGEFSWKGVSSSYVSYASVPMVLTDGSTYGSYEGIINADISGSEYFAAGHHEVEFYYGVDWATYFMDTDRMTVYGLSLRTSPVEEHSARLLTEELTMPNSLIDKEETATQSDFVYIRNIGSEPLKMTGATDSPHFKAEVSDREAVMLGSLRIPLTFEASEPGLYEETVTVSTTAGDFEVMCSALVREAPDFSVIVKEGDFSIHTDAQNPWLVADGKAYNSTSKVIDNERTTCTLVAEFEVPEGYMGKLSWKGRLSTAGLADNTWTDYLSIEISSSLGTKICLVPGEYDLDSSLYPYFAEPNMNDLLCGPGQCSLTFNYVQVGDATYGAEDLAEIYDLALELLDHEGSSGVIDRDEVEFPAIYAGKSAEVEVHILNTGIDPLEVFDVEGEGPFSARFNNYAAQYNQSVTVMITFDPEEAGDYSGIVEIGTTSGIFEVHCTGTALSTDGMLLIEDFEDDAAGWRIYDRDGDGDGWNLAYNVYGGFPQSHVHSGEECIVSFSWDYITGTFYPDNWTFSPQFEVPEQGAWLTWWSAGDDNSRPGDIYSVYVGEGTPEIGQDFDIDVYKCVYTEKVISDEWTQHFVDISEFKGKEVHVAFRHYDCSGCYMVKIDDVIVYDHQPAGTPAIETGAEPIATEYYTIDGHRLHTLPASGIVIVRETLSDGSVRTKKIAK